MDNDIKGLCLIIALIVFLYFIGSYIAATIAIKKGQPGCLVFILSMIINPIFMIIIALLLHDRYENRSS